MRTLALMVSTALVLVVLTACTVSREEDDDAVAADATETPVMDTQQTDDADDAVVDDATDDADDSVVDDAEVDDAVTDDDEAVDDATDDATDDADVDDAADDTVTEDEDEEAEPAEHIIEIEGMEFSPGEITIAAGDTVTWVNNTDMVHTSSADPEIATDEANVELPEGAETWHSGNIEPGEEYSVTLTVPGTYVYFCYPHQDGGMIGTIIVADPEAEVDDAETDVTVDDADDTDVTVDDADDPDAEPDPDADDYDGDYDTDDDSAPAERQYNGKDSTS